MRAAAALLGLGPWVSCAVVEPDPAPSAAVLLHARRIYLGHPGWEAVEALLVAEGRVVRAGSLAELRRAAPAARAIDLGGCALPGLQDAHGHIEGLGKALETVDLRGVPSYAELIERVAAQAERQPAGTWVEGCGWDQNLWPLQQFPEHGALSERVREHPVFLRRIDGHAALCNQSALSACGLEAEPGRLPTLEGGEILRAADGRASGVLIDAAMDLVAGHIPAPDEATRERRLLAAQQALLAVGLTCVHDMGVDRWTVRTLERLRDEGRWNLRVVLYLGMGADTRAEDLAGFPQAADAADVLAVPGVKLYIDGALGSRGAALLEDYSDRPGYRGLLQMQPEELKGCLELCGRLGLQPATHAIGDRGNRIVLDAYAGALRADAGFAALRPRIEHAQVVAPEDWPRFRALGVVASMQPTHCTSDMPWVPQRLGLERSLGAYAWRRLAPDPSALAFGSDFPVEEIDPLCGVYVALTRQDAQGNPPGGFFPGERLDAREALCAFTFGAARACRQEDRRGRLAPGFAADLTVLDVDPLACGPSDLLRARVLFTIVNGVVVHAAEDD